MNSQTFLRGRPLFQLLVFLLSFAGAGLCAAEPADGQIKAAVDDIEKYEKQFAGGGAINAATVNRTLRMLGLTRERLDSSSNKSHPSWQEANARLNALIDRLQVAKSGKPTEAKPSSPPTTTSAAATRNTAGSSAPPQMISQQRVRIKKLTRDVASATESMDQAGVKPFQDPTYVEQRLQSAARFKESLANYAEFAGDADVTDASEALARYENMIAFGQNHAAQEAGKHGDPQASLRALDGQLGRVPASPVEPYAENSVPNWLVEIAKMRQSAATALQQLAVIREHAHLPVQPGTVSQGSPYDMQDVSRLEAGYRNNVSKIDESLVQFKADLDSQVSHVTGTLEYVDKLDPADDSNQTNAFLGAGAAAGVRERLDAANHLVSVAVDFDRQLGRPELAAHSIMLERTVQGRADYDRKLAKARKLVRMPKAASTDKSLLAIARETLKNPDYEVGTIRRLVINAEKVHREMKTSDTEFDKVDVSLSGKVTLSGTETTYFYPWDQFQVTTAEQVGDTFFLFYNTLKIYTSGAPTTPLNRWILAGRIQGSEIPAANIDRD